MVTKAAKGKLGLFNKTPGVADALLLEDLTTWTTLNVTALTSTAHPLGYYPINPQESYPQQFWEDFQQFMQAKDRFIKDNLQPLRLARHIVCSTPHLALMDLTEQFLEALLLIGFSMSHAYEFVEFFERYLGLASTGHEQRDCNRAFSKSFAHVLPKHFDLIIKEEAFAYLSSIGKKAHLEPGALTYHHLVSTFCLYNFLRANASQ
jgi:hypothetical protein